MLRQTATGGTKSVLPQESAGWKPIAGELSVPPRSAGLKIVLPMMRPDMSLYTATPHQLQVASIGASSTVAAGSISRVAPVLDLIRLLLLIVKFV